MTVTVSPQKLSFTGTPASTEINLQNGHKSRYAYKIMTGRPMLFSLTSVTGILEKDELKIITITLKGSVDELMPQKDKFLMQFVPIKEGTTESDIKSNKGLFNSADVIQEKLCIEETEKTTSSCANCRKYQEQIKDLKSRLDSTEQRLECVEGYAEVTNKLQSELSREGTSETAEPTGVAMNVFDKKVGVPGLYVIILCALFYWIGVMFK